MAAQSRALWRCARCAAAIVLQKQRRAWSIEVEVTRAARSAGIRRAEVELVLDERLVKITRHRSSRCARRKRGRAGRGHEPARRACRCPRASTPEARSARFVLHRRRRRGHPGRPSPSAEWTSTPTCPAIALGDAGAFGRWLAGAEPRLRESLRPFAARVDTEAAAAGDAAARVAGGPRPPAGRPPEQPAAGLDAHRAQPVHRRDPSCPIVTDG
jgi:hypothetical protein